MYRMGLVSSEFIFLAGIHQEKKFLNAARISVSQEKLSTSNYKVACELCCSFIAKLSGKKKI